MRRVFRGAYTLRRAQAALARRVDEHAEQSARSEADLAAGRAARGASRRRNILFITVDQQRPTLKRRHPL
jgi:hypothetical protein